MNIKTFTLRILLVNLIVSIIAFILGKGFPKDALITVFSFFQLLFISFISWKIYKARNNGSNHITFNASYLIWAIIALGFFYLAIDEVVELHEELDKFIHKIFHINQTGITDRIDDLIIGIYALIGVGIMIYYKNELIKYREIFPLLFTGMVFVVLSIVFDALTNRKDILQIIFEGKMFVEDLHQQLKIVEDSIEIFAEGIILCSFYWCLQISKTLFPQSPMK